MKGSSINDIVDVLEELNLISDQYKESGDIKSHLTSYKGAIYSQNIPYIANSLVDYSLNKKLIGRFDIPFITLSKEEVDGYLKIFNELDNSIRIKQLGLFKENPEHLYERIDFCIKNGIPYKDGSNILFNEVNFANECGFYLKSKVISELPQYELTDNKKNIFYKTCGALQTRVYDSMKEKLPITDELADVIIEIVKSDPNLTNDDIDYVVKKTIEKLPYLNVIVDTESMPFIGDTTNNMHERNGQR